MNNEVRDAYGRTVGYRCSECDKVKQAMWGTVCNACRTLAEMAADLKRLAVAAERGR